MQAKARSAALTFGVAALLAACGPVQGGTSSSAAVAASPSAAPGGPTWTEVHPAAQPLPRNSAAAAFDEATGTMIVSGGEHGCAPSATYYSDTWSWNGSQWTQLHPHNQGPAEMSVGSVHAYDAATQRVVLVSWPPSCGETTLTWQWDGSDWIGPDPTSNDPGNEPMPSGAMAYDAATRSLVLWDTSQNGSGPPVSQTWTYDHGTWSLLHPAHEPAAGETNSYNPNGPPISESVMGYDAATQRVVLYNTRTQKAWAWDGSDWTDAPVSGGPSARVDSSMVYDEALHSFVLFGGASVTGYSPPASPGDLGNVTVGGALGDTWTWDGTTWTQLHPAASPTARFLAQMAYDTVHHQVVVFGGAFSDTADGNDTWVFGTASSS